MANWDILRLKEAGVTLLDCDHKTPTAHDEGRPYVGIPQMTTGRVVFESSRKISEVDYVHWTRKTKYQTNDVILSRRTNPGVTAVDDTGTEFALGQNLVLLRADGSRVLPEFLRWLVHTPQWWEQIDKYLNVGAVFSSLKCRDVPKFELTVPPMNEQHKINSILRPIADKIELNRRMNETLEEMARALFRDWFVDFGPTRRQMAGETDPTKIMGNAFPPEKAATLAPLFPSALGDDGLPEGWSLSSVGALSEKVTKGTTPRKTDISAAIAKETVPFYRVVNLSNKGRLLQNSVQRVPEDVHEGVLKRSVLNAGDILYSIAGTIGRVCKLDENDVPANLNQALAIVRPDTSKITANFLLLWLRSRSVQDELHSNIVQAVQANLSLGMISGAPVLSPPIHGLLQIMEPIDLLLKNSNANEQENKTLAALRDLLLPKLMSGEIRLKDAEAAV